MTPLFRLFLTFSILSLSNLSTSFDMSLGINARYSVRSFSDDPIAPSLLDELEDVLVESADSTPFANPVTFKLVHDQLCTYPNGASYYVCGSVKSGDLAAVDYGYALEKVILWAAENKLGTCWLAGTFNREKTKGHLSDFGPDDRMLAVTPVGHPSALMPTVTRSRVSWSKLFFNASFDNPIDSSDTDNFVHSALDAIWQAPTAENKQDVRIVVISEAKVRVYIKFAYPDAYQWLDWLDAGIAMAHFDVIVKENGKDGKWIRETDMENLENGAYVATWVE